MFLCIWSHGGTYLWEDLVQLPYMQQHISCCGRKEMLVAVDKSGAGFTQTCQLERREYPGKLKSVVFCL